MIKTSQVQILNHIKYDLKIKPEDIVFLHSGIRELGHLEGGPLGVLKVFEDYLVDGALIVPTFTYSWYKGTGFNELESVGKLMGPIANATIGNNRYVRTNHPTFSVNIRSDSKDLVAKLMPTSRDVFGPGSIFCNLYDQFPDSKILLFGGAFSDCKYKSTFTHTAQQLGKAWYRYLKTFEDPLKQEKEITQFVRYLTHEEYVEVTSNKKPSVNFPIIESSDQYAHELERLGILNVCKFGYGTSRITQVGNSIDYFRGKLTKDPDYGLAQ